MKIEFPNRRVLITGGGGGLGRALVKEFLKSRATVFALDFDDKLLVALKQEFPSVNTIQSDITDWSATKKAIECCLPLDHLVNNAGISRHEPFLEFTAETITSVNNVNYTALYNTSQIFAKDAIKNGNKGATIVNISSIAAQVQTPTALPYCASKAATECLTKNLAVGLGPKGIRVNAIAPTGMPTPIILSAPDELKESAGKIFARQPIPGMVETEEAAHLVMFLSSPFARMITGQVIAIDGGLSVA